MPCAPQWIDVKALLSFVPLFKDMAPAGLERLADASREIRAIRGDTLFRKDEPCGGLYVVVYGRVKLFFLSAQGREKILDILDQGHALSEETLFLGNNYQVYAQTLSDCSLLLISKAAIVAELESDPVLARRVIDGLSQKLDQRTADIESCSLQSGRQRVIHYLLRETVRPKSPVMRASGEKGRTPDWGDSAARIESEKSPLVVKLVTRKSDIASRLSLTQEHFSRILHELSACGLIFLDNRLVYIADIEQLRTAAG